MAKKFIRRDWRRYSRLGKNRKSKQKWRHPTGRHNKIREKRKGYPAMISVGYKKDSASRGKIRDKIPVMINNINDLKKIGKENIGIIGRFGKKKKIEILKKAKEMKVPIHNINAEKFLEKISGKNNNKINKQEEKKE